MREEYFTYKSADGISDISAKVWTHETVTPVAVLQIAHGMNEYKERYDGFAGWLAERGLVVCANDHPGHGDSVSSQDKLGRVEGRDPEGVMLSDMHTLREKIAPRYPELPYFMMGHSMGSYLLRDYLSRHGEDLAGALIMGTGQMPVIVGKFSVTVPRIMAAFKGWDYHSKLIPKLMYDKYYRRYDLTGQEPDRNWLTRDAEIVKAYYTDPKCTFKFALSGYMALFTAVEHCAHDKVAGRIPASLPMLVMSGDADPVGSLGKSTRKAYEQLIRTGHANTTLKLLPGCRHELINELGHDKIYEDILNWMKQYI